MEHKQPTANLSAHSGAVKVSRHELALIPAPARTASHVPVAHIELVESIERSLDRRGFSIEKEEFAVQTEGMKIFGTMVLKASQSDYAFALGFRAANDKTMAISMCAGANVFVCDNMAFSGSLVTLTRKHTSGLNLFEEIEGGVVRAVGQFGNLKADIDGLKAKDLTNKDVVAKAFILDAALKGVMPLRLIPSVAKHYFQPPHEEFAPRNAWSLHNAFTEAFKELKPNVAMEASIDLGSMFQMGARVQ